MKPSPFAPYVQPDPPELSRFVDQAIAQHECYSHSELLKLSVPDVARAAAYPQGTFESSTVFLEEVCVLPGEIIPCALAARHLSDRVVLFSREDAKVGTEAVVVAHSQRNPRMGISLVLGLRLVERAEDAWRDVTRVQAASGLPFPAHLRVASAPASRPDCSGWPGFAYCGNLLRWYESRHKPVVLPAASRQYLFHEPCEASRLVYLRQCTQPASRLVCVHCKCVLVPGPLAPDASTVTYINPAFVVCQIVRISQRPANVVALGNPNLNFSWFPGYGWRGLICDQCNVHLGWDFTPVGASTMSASSAGAAVAVHFWGLLLNSVEYAFAARC
jgi:hypothetical protein